jgi:hypothetical protein
MKTQNIILICLVLAGLSSRKIVAQPTEQNWKGENESFYRLGREMA